MLVYTNSLQLSRIIEHPYFAIGAMIGVGSATKFKIQRASEQSDADSYFSNAVLWAILLSIPFILIGILLPEQLIHFLGGDVSIVAIGTPYARLVLCFSPFFMLNHILNAFVQRILWKKGFHLSKKSLEIIRMHRFAYLWLSSCDYQFIHIRDYRNF